MLNEGFIKAHNKVIPYIKNSIVFSKNIRKGSNYHKHVLNYESINQTIRRKMDDYDHILIIDDDKTFIKVNHKIFSNITGCNNVNFKMSGTTALEFLADMHQVDQFPDLITLDWRMALGNGEDFLKAYEQKYKASYPQTKILIITEASQEVTDRTQSLTFVAGVLAKPLQLAQLKQIL